MSRHLTMFSLICLLAFGQVRHVDAEDANDQPYSLLRTRGSLIVDEHGDEVVLKGCNLGNWLLLEMWMLGIDHHQFPDQWHFEKNLADRFGESEKDRLMDIYRANWITPRDFKIINTFGFNTVRLPFNYRLLEEDDKPFHLKPHAFKWLDRAIEMAEAEGIYVILDMHGVPGGQSIDHPTGRVDQNKLWNDPVYAKRTAWLWRQIAERYKDRKSVAGYDVINEPYGDFSTDVRPKLKPIFTDIYQAIRDTGDPHIVWAPAPLWGGHGFYGNPHENGWTNVGFTEHHYPGLFGSDPSLHTHADFIYRTLPEKQAELDRVQTPLFVGEWNPVFERLGGGNLMRRYFDEYAKHGWAATIWSYKILSPEGGNINDNWFMVSNAKPLDQPDFKTASKESIEAYFKWFGTMKYVIDEPMRLALTRPDPVPVGLPVPPKPITEAPHHDRFPGWTATDINGSYPGGEQVHSETDVTVYGGGKDIWDRVDQFRFVWQEAQGDFTLTAALLSLRDTQTYAKAGLMTRASLDPDSAQALVHAFPNGRVAFSWRPAKGQPMQEVQAPNDSFPIHLKLTRKGDTFAAAYSTDGQTWHPLHEPVTLNGFPPTCDLGLAVLSHVENALTEARFKDIRVSQDKTPR